MEPAEASHNLVKQDALSELSQTIGLAKANFCCGGSVRTITKENTDPVAGPSVPPVVIRWDVPDGSSVGKVTLPALESTSQPTALSELLESCAPATFGRGAGTVLDESYRQAVKLDQDQFSTNFSPYLCGIVDAIAQTLLPGVAEPYADGVTRFVEHLGVLAKPYALNIYSGPSGKFRPHVDTPRSPRQFGSLVVCLPHPHQGGHLRISHKGVESFWDWSNDGTDKIEWAAFYSDCEHEVLEVQTGHRVTLTYNLYVYEQVGKVIRKPPTALPESYPLHAKVKQILKRPDFLKDGGTLGFYCTHAYAHSNSDHAKRIPFALKGVDMIVYAVFASLGLRGKVRPVLARSYHTQEGVQYDSEDEADRYDPSDSGEEGEYEMEADPGKPMKLVPNHLYQTMVTAFGKSRGDAGAWEVAHSAWNSETRSDIHWLNEPGPKQLALVHLAYGNQTSIAWRYSAAAILIDVPSSAVRGST